ncbi:unnamed protein product, partial [Callosobruchus maculatus]
ASIVRPRAWRLLCIIKFSLFYTRSCYSSITIHVLSVAYHITMSKVNIFPEINVEVPICNYPGLSLSCSS